MIDFPEFMKNPLNRIAASSRYTEDIEGYVFDGADGSQVAFWTCAKDRVSADHATDSQGNTAENVGFGRDEDRARVRRDAGSKRLVG